MKYQGYIGKESKKRRRNKYIFFIFFILMIFFLYIFIREKNITQPNNTMKVEENLLYKDQSLQLTILETKIHEYDQKLQLRNQLIKSLKDQIKDLEKNIQDLEKNIQDLEKNNNELLDSIKLQSIKKNELNNFEKTIITLKKNEQKQNNKLLLFEEKNIELNDQIQILNDTINKLLLQKNELSKKIKNLQNNTIEKEKIIENLKDKIHH